MNTNLKYKLLNHIILNIQYELLIHIVSSMNYVLFSINSNVCCNATICSCDIEFEEFVPWVGGTELSVSSAAATNIAVDGVVPCSY